MKNSRWLSLIVLCTGFLLIVVDMTIVNVALPSIQKDLGFSASGLAWVINAYLIAFGGLLLLAGRVGDLVGRKKVFLAGLAIFTAASVVCGLSFAQPVLVVARFIQGIGGAVSSAVILAMIVTMFPEPLERAKAFGIFSFVASAGAAVGLIAGGLIIGVGEKLAEVYWGPLVGGAIENWFAYVLALAFLLFRPQGLFGEKIIDRV